MLSEHFCRTGRIGATYESCGQYDVEEGEVRRALRMAVSFARAIGLLRGPAPRGDDPIICSGRRRSEVIRAPCNGLYVRGPRRLCERVKKGEVLGHVLSDRDLSCVNAVSRRGGWLRHFGPGRPGCDVSLKQLHPHVRRGELLAVVSWPVPGPRVGRSRK
jgi:hypothetical protein